MSRFIGLLLMLWSAYSFAEWPRLPFPKDAKVEAIGDEVRLNGVPMRMHRILSAQNAEHMLDFYRQALGPKHAEARVHQVRILSQMRGDYFITVRVNTLGPKLTETLLAISDGSHTKHGQTLPLGFTLPVGSDLLSDMESVDAGKNSRQLIFQNQHSLQANGDFITNILLEKGYKPQPKYTQSNDKSLSLLFGGHQREAMVVVTRNAGKTDVVMTTILGQ